MAAIPIRLIQSSIFMSVKTIHHLYFSQYLPTNLWPLVIVEIELLLAYLFEA